jgi:2-C-methyl-D-erythritol 4-phosphate cytidylyltransferase
VSIPRCFLVIPAAGSGRRMQQELPKQYLEVLGKPLLQHTLENLGDLGLMQGIVLAVSPQDHRIDAVLAALPAALRSRITLVHGGAERANSVLAAVTALADRADPEDWVLVHDAVRPCVRQQDVLRLLDAVRDEPAGGLLAQPVRDTLKLADASGYVLRTVDRTGLWQAATPQAFRHAILLRALRESAARGAQLTDESAAVEALGMPVRLVQGSADNVKLTWPEDLSLLATLLQAQAAAEQI